VKRRLARRPLRFLSVALLGVLAATGLTGCHGSPHAAVVASGLEFPAAFTIDPNGVDLWYTERFTGEVRRFNQDSDENTLVDTIPNVTTVGREQGTFGIALHPNYPTTRQVFVLATVLVSGRPESRSSASTSAPTAWPPAARRSSTSLPPSSTWAAASSSVPTGSCTSPSGTTSCTPTPRTPSTR
jgi:glucose/arabinose dehydrogenase